MAWMLCDDTETAFNANCCKLLQKQLEITILTEQIAVQYRMHNNLRKFLTWRNLIGLKLLKRMTQSWKHERKQRYFCTTQCKFVEVTSAEV